MSMSGSSGDGIRVRMCNADRRIRSRGIAMTPWSKRYFHADSGNAVGPGPAARERFDVARILRIGLWAFLLPLAGCPYYAAPPGTVVMTPASYDRSFAAASGAMHDEGVTVTVQDPGSGNVVGTLDGSTVTASVRQQADGSVVVQFNSRDARDPTLLDRISRSYDRRMG